MQYNLYMKTSVDIFTDPVGRMPYIGNEDYRHRVRDYIYFIFESSSLSTGPFT